MFEHRPVCAVVKTIFQDQTFLGCFVSWSLGLPAKAITFATNGNLQHNALFPVTFSTKNPIDQDQRVLLSGTTRYINNTALKACIYACLPMLTGGSRDLASVSDSRPISDRAVAVGRMEVCMTGVCLTAAARRGLSRSRTNCLRSTAASPPSAH